MLRIRIDVYIADDARLEFSRTRNGSVEIIDFEPEQYPVSHGKLGIDHGSVMVVDVPCMKLQNQAVRTPNCMVKFGINEPFVLTVGMTILSILMAACAAE